MKTDPGTFEIEITALAHDGRGIGFLPQSGQKRGLAIFVERALPGQTVKCREVKAKGNYREAKLLEVSKSAFEPVPPFCPQQAICGGCVWQPLPHEKQLFWKERLIFDALGRIGKLPEKEIKAAWEGIKPSPKSEHYRNSITLAFGLDGQGKPALGLRGIKGHEIVNFPGCALADGDIAPIVEQAYNLAEAGGLPFYDNGRGFWRFLALRKDYKGRWHGLAITSKAGRPEQKTVAALGEILLRCNPALASFTHWERRKDDYLSKGDSRGLAVLGDANFAIELCGRLFGLDAASFFQTNSGAANILADMARDMDKEASGPLLDLYCGVGAPGQLLAERHQTCLGIEKDGLAVKWARENAKQTNLGGWQYEKGDVVKKLAGIKAGNFGLILLDPPRSGVGKEGMEKMAKLNAPHIMYISCDSATLARDASILKDKYALTRLAAVDMFPNTPHVECAGLWRRK